MTLVIRHNVIDELTATNVPLFLFMIKKKYNKIQQQTIQLTKLLLLRLFHYWNIFITNVKKVLIDLSTNMQ